MVAVGQATAPLDAAEVDLSRDTPTRSDSWEGGVSLGGVSVGLSYRRPHGNVVMAFSGEGVRPGIGPYLTASRALETADNLLRFLEPGGAEGRPQGGRTAVLYEDGTTDADRELRMVYHDSLDISAQAPNTGSGAYVLTYSEFDAGDSERLYMWATREQLRELAEAMRSAGEFAYEA